MSLLAATTAGASAVPIESSLFLAEASPSLFSDEETPLESLFFASMTGDVERALSALSRGADPNVANARGITPLLVACGGVGPVGMLEALLSAGAGCDSADPDGWTPLTYAASSGQLALMDTLIASGANVSGGENRPIDAWTPLARAAYRGHVNAVILLMKSGARIEDLVSGKSAVEWASDAGHHDVVLQLLK